MKVLFLYPPETDSVKSYLSHLENEEGIGFKPPLGILYVATHVRDNTPHDVRVVDCHVHRYSCDQVVDIVDGYQPDVVGITAWTDFWYSASEIITRIKTKHPDIFLVVGGPHVLCFPEETLNFSGVDAVVAGDGEVPMVKLLDCLESGKTVDGIPGLHFKNFGVHSKRYYYERDPDSLAIPDRTLLPVERYSSVLGNDRLITTMITSRGCPFSCVFCKIHAQRPVRHSADRVLEEFDRIHQLGIREVEIYDDTFTWSHKRVIDICKGLIHRDYHIKWAIRDRVSDVREQTLQWMKKAGCNRIHYGIESGCDDVLRRVKKRITVEEAENAVQLSSSLGFQVLTFFMIGLPGETADEIRQTIDFSLKLNSDYCQYSITIPYPGTQMYIEGLKSGVYPTDFWRDFARHPVPNFKVPFFHFSDMTLEDMIRFRNRAILKYYYRPRTILKEIKKVRTKEAFMKKFRMAVTLLKSAIS